MEAPKIPGFFKSRGPKTFNFPARYYDERKERIQKRRELLKREIQAENKLDPESRTEFKDLAQKHWKSGTYKKASKQSNFRIAMILAILIFIFVWLWNQMGGIL